MSQQAIRLALQVWMVWLFLALAESPTRSIAGATARFSPAPGSTEGFDPSKLRDITGIERTPAPPPSGVAWKIWSSVGVGLLAACALGAWGFRRLQNRTKSPLPPDRWARIEMDNLESRALPAAGKIEDYHTCLSDIIRRYLEARFQLAATRQTTQEFLSSLPQNVDLRPPQQELLKEFLIRCDWAKFAGASGSATDSEATRRLARQFVDETALPSHAVAPPAHYPSRPR